MDNLEIYLILKYGTFYKAYTIWINTYQSMPADLHDAINLFFKDFDWDNDRRKQQQNGNILSP